MIEIKITGSNPLDTLANVTAYGILCMENREVFDAAGTILATARGKQKQPAAAEATISAHDAVPPMSPPAAPAVPSESVGGTMPDPEPASVPAPVAGVPVTPAPDYTLEQISRAGAELIGRDPSLRDTLMGLLRDQGVEAVTQLDPSQFGAYATALRGLGAKI